MPVRPGPARLPGFLHRVRASDRGWHGARISADDEPPRTEGASPFGPGRRTAGVQDGLRAWSGAPGWRPIGSGSRSPAPETVPGCACP